MKGNRRFYSREQLKGSAPRDHDRTSNANPKSSKATKPDDSVCSLSPLSLRDRPAYSILFLKIRIVWPAFFSMAGTVILVGYATAVLGFFSLIGPVYDQSLSFSEALPYLSIGLSGMVGLGFSLALMFNEARHRLWGILVLAPYGTASFYYLTQLYFPVLIKNATIPLPGWFWPLAGALFLGLLGAIGGILWKPREARAEPRASSNQNLKD